MRHYGYWKPTGKVDISRDGYVELDRGGRNYSDLQVTTPDSDYDPSSKKYVDDMARKWAMFNGV